MRHYEKIKSVKSTRPLYEEGRRCHVLGWSAHEEEVSKEFHGHVVAAPMPKVVYLQFYNTTWSIGDLPIGVYPMTDNSRNWKVNKSTGIQARRTGFFLLPDFGSTSFMIQGQSREAVICHNVDYADPLTDAALVDAYVSFSRVKKLAGIYLLGAFSPYAFKRGAPLAPDLLLKVLRREITLDEALRQFAEHDMEEPEENKSDPMMQSYRCMQCFAAGRANSMKKVKTSA